MISRVKVLIIGGYGMFGSRLVQLLKDEPRLTLIIAGRSRARAKTLCIVQSQAEMVPAEFDRGGDVEAQIGSLEPDIVIDASGPFQAYGDDPYKVVRGALAVGADYLDLADATDFVLGIADLNDAVKASGRFVLSGVSTCPVLTCAAARALAGDLASVEQIAAGIAPSPHVGLGANVVRAVLGYAGKPVGIVRNGAPATAAALADSRDYTIVHPGAVSLFRKRFSLVDVPDLKLLAAAWPRASEIWFGVATEPGILLRLLNVLARLVERRIIPSMTWCAPFVGAVSNTIKWGEHRGGMFVRLYGQDRRGTLCRRRWHLIAEGDKGPFIPAMAAAVVIRNCLAGRPPAVGARPAASELELDNFAPYFDQLDISTALLKDVPEDRSRPVFRRLLDHPFEELAAPLQAFHDIAGKAHYRGRSRIERGRNPVARLVATVMRFPKAGRDRAVEVELSVADQVETWRRSFDGMVFRSTFEVGSGRYEGLLVERSGPLCFGMALVADEGHLNYLMRRWDIFGLPLPRLLAPRIVAFEHAARDRFNFSVTISMPLIGLIVGYRGWLEPDADDRDKFALQTLR